jgi:hypothetical protein
MATVYEVRIIAVIEANHASRARSTLVSTFIHLERDFAPERQLLGAVDRAHSSTADERLDLVAGELASDYRVGAASHAHPRKSVSGT